MWLLLLNCWRKAKHTVSTLEINKIVTLKRCRGALEGLKYGALIGCTAGFIWGAAHGLPLTKEDDEYGFGSILACCSFGTIYAGAHGLPIGLIIGSKDKYIFVAPLDSSLNNNMKDWCLRIKRSSKHLTSLLRSFFRFLLQLINRDRIIHIHLCFTDFYLSSSFLSYPECVLKSGEYRYLN